MSSVSIVIISFNRPKEILRNVKELSVALNKDVEIVIVDNNSSIPVELVIKEFSWRVQTIKLRENVGVEARNIGVEAANGDLVITLDDDVFGFSQADVESVCSIFELCPDVAAINFKVIDDATEEQMNWCHHRKIDIWSDRMFETYEISEGAVAFRKEAFVKSGMYPSYYFISHEGPDLALGIMNNGWSVVYCPDIFVRHAHSMTARVSWRRYYYDTRNVIWLGVRRYPIFLFLKVVPFHLIAMFIYSVRDGYSKYWIKGVFDAFVDIRKVLNDRDPISKCAYLRYVGIRRFNPGLFYMLKRRVFKRGVSI